MGEAVARSQRDGANGLVRAAGFAALVVGLAFAIHVVNGAFVEPRYLGFGGYADYADLPHLERASRALPWLFSGLGHTASGFALVVVALGAYVRYRDLRPAPALLALAAGLLSATGFLLLGLTHVIGRESLFLLGDANPGLRDAAYMATTVARIWFNSLAQACLGWFALELAWCGAVTRTLPRAFIAWSVVSGGTGLVMIFAYVPVYLVTVLVWAPWLGVILLGQTRAGR